MPKYDLRISNIVFTGKLPIKGKIDMEQIRSKSKLFWEIANEEVCPILQTRVNFSKEPKFNIHGKHKQACVSIWANGSINIVGVTSRKQAEKCYELAYNEVFGKSLK